jgi:hypothetical protein
MLYVVLAMGYIGVIAAEVLQHPKMLARAIKKRFDEGIYQSQKVAFVLQDDSITTTTNGNHEKRITWDEFQKIVETPDGFLMYLNKQVFLWLPLSALRPADSSDTLRTIWREYKLEYARVK